MQLSILMPCLNEAETLAICIKKAQAWLLRTNTSGEIIVADNGSTDGSQAIALQHGARVVAVPTRGYGSALYYGALAANGQYIIMGDADDSYDFSQLDNFMTKLQQGYDLVMGNRFLGGIAPGAMPWKNRYIGNPLLSWIGRVLFHCAAQDFHCGLRGFSKAAFLRMDLRTTGMEFASEMVIKASLFGMKIAQVPTTLAKDGRSRPPHLRPWRDGWRHLRFMLLFSPRWLFFIPGMMIFLISMIFYLLILINPLPMAHLVFDIHTLFYAQAGVTIGLLSLIFGLMIRMFGGREGLLQEHRLLEQLHNSPVLEIGSVIGLLLIAIGVYLGFNLLSIWSEQNFGQLAYGGLLRSVSLSTLLITLGGISFLASLVMGFLALPAQRSRCE